MIKIILWLSRLLACSIFVSAILFRMTGIVLTECFHPRSVADHLPQLTQLDCVGSFERTSNFALEGFLLSPDGRYFGYSTSCMGSAINESGTFSTDGRIVHVRARLHPSALQNNVYQFDLYPMYDPFLSGYLKDLNRPPFALSRSRFPLLSQIEETKRQERAHVLTQINSVSDVTRSVLLNVIYRINAMIRGRPDCYLDSIGWVHCPVCRSYLNPLAALHEGQHTTCGTYLNVHRLPPLRQSTAELPGGTYPGGDRQAARQPAVASDQVSQHVIQSSSDTRSMVGPPNLR